jgi:hypothetical protein
VVREVWSVIESDLPRPFSRAIVSDSAFHKVVRIIN